ncbi:VWFD domain-containing protein [Microcystis aeruginosa]
MPYTPPLIKPSLPSLPPSAPFPFRPPVVSPPTQTAPTYQPPDLLPPTELDLKGGVCIYSNSPIWELKKIRYRYPGEAWQEIPGERYTINNSGIPPAYFANWLIFDAKLIIRAYGGDAPGVYEIFFPDISFSGTLTSINSYPIGSLWGGNLYWTYTYFVAEYSDSPQFVASLHPGHLNLMRSPYNEILAFTYRLKNLDTEEEPPFDNCQFKVFDISNQEILSITRDVCPEVIVVPERCYFQPENEKLASKINLSFGQSLEIKYNANCATVLLYSYPFPNPIQVYKECSDNPNCPPPKIRFDKKCEEKEKCEQCPKGTAAKVLIGSTITCVDKNGCIKKIIKYQPGCNTYDCVC